MDDDVLFTITCGGYRIGRVLLSIGLLHNVRIGYRGLFLSLSSFLKTFAATAIIQPVV
jgi:hypothetical protein